MEQRNRVLIIGDVINGFRFHGPFTDPNEAFAYVDRHRKHFSEGWASTSRSTEIINLDKMTDAEIVEYEAVVGHGWADCLAMKAFLEDAH